MADINQIERRTRWDASLLDKVEYRLCRTEIEREEIFRLRHRAYVYEGAIAPRPDGLLTDRFDDAPNSWIFGVYIADALVSSIRVSVATPANPDTPALDAFGDLLLPEIALGKTIVDPNRFVADPGRTQRFPELPYLTVRLGYVACAYFNADIGTATVRKEHQAFYRRVFLQRALCEPRPYPTLIKPLSLMVANYREVRDRIYQRYPMFHASREEMDRLFASSRPADAPAADLDLPEAAAV